MKITQADYKKFEAIWRKRNPGQRVDRELLQNAAESLLKAVKHIYLETEFESREQ